MGRLTELEKELAHLLKDKQVDEDSIIGMVIALQDDIQAQKELIQWIKDNPTYGQEEIVGYVFDLPYGDDELDDEE